MKANLRTQLESLLTRPPGIFRARLEASARVMSSTTALVATVALTGLLVCPMLEREGMLVRRLHEGWMTQSVAAQLVPDGELPSRQGSVDPADTVDAAVHPNGKSPAAETAPYPYPWLDWTIAIGTALAGLALLAMVVSTLGSVRGRRKVEARARDGDKGRTP